MFYTQKDREEIQEDLAYVFDKIKRVQSGLEVEMDILQEDFERNLNGIASLAIGLAIALKVSPKKLASMFSETGDEVNKYRAELIEEMMLNEERDEKKSAKKKK